MFSSSILRIILAMAAVVAMTTAAPQPGFGHGHVSYGHQIHHGHHGGFGGFGGYGHGHHGGFGGGKSFVYFNQHFPVHHGYH
ncbi:holotricin-3 [Hyalella azteca]|uniref:Holotricin-3 n=1 Tax=Hyalella azteca TaxID=294128 RepID=A0A8B7PIN2_HYAAZ|nr:holotricin-3 [Hyalella azteca]